MGFEACSSLKATKYPQSSSIYSSGERNPSNLQLDQRKGLSISRHKYYLHQTQQFYIQCAAFNLKTYNKPTAENTTNFSREKAMGLNSGQIQISELSSEDLQNNYD